LVFGNQIKIMPMEEDTIGSIRLSKKLVLQRAMFGSCDLYYDRKTNWQEQIVKIKAHNDKYR